VKRSARAFWTVPPDGGEIRETELPDPGPDDVLVRTLHSAVSRGTELLVLRGAVPADQVVTMRAPFQEGDFPGPVKYGYLNVGIVEDGPDALIGRTVFCLYPHQSAYVVPADAVVPVPAEVPARRAVLAGTVETAINALWDAPPLIGDRIAVVGAGMVGCCVARLAAGIPGATVTLVDVDPQRAVAAAAVGAEFATPQSISGEFDLVVHASASAAGLRCALGLLAPDTAVLELSWYGDGEVALPLGGAMHAKRLGVRMSQVGTVSPSRAARRTSRDRLLLALDILRDPAFDALLDGPSPFRALPEVLPALAGRPGLCHTISYDDEE
jgi:threonine dehydrogenase-like Zn-dependent dehydrogenase